MKNWSSSNEKTMHLLIIAGLGALVYANTLENLFVWNDWILIIRNPLIRSWGNLPEILFSYQWKPLVGEPTYIYRPLLLLTYMVDIEFWIFQPWGFHLTNLTLHLLNGVLVYLLLVKYLHPRAALLGALLFVVHPVQTESVTYISGRAEPLMALFLLSGLLVFLQSGERKSWLLYLASLPLVFLSLLAKETAIFFPIVLIVWDVCAGHNLTWRDRLLRCIGLLFVIAIYLWLRHYAMGGELYLYEGRIQLLTTLFWFLNAIPTVMTSLFFPMNPHFPLSQHHLYLPSMVIFTLVAAIFHLLARKVTMRYALLGIILISVLLGGITFRHNSIWRDELILSERALETAPGHPVALWLLGESYLPRGRSPEAIELFKKTLALNQANPRIHESLGLASRLLHKPTKALVHYQRAALLAPDHPYYHWITARHYRRMKRFGEAEVYFSNAARLNPRSSELRNDLAYSYYIQGKNDDSIAELKEALKVLPYSSTLKENLAQALKRKKLQSRGGSKNP